MRKMAHFFNVRAKRVHGSDYNRLVDEDDESVGSRVSKTTTTTKTTTSSQGNQEGEGHDEDGGGEQSSAKKQKKQVDYKRWV